MLNFYSVLKQKVAEWKARKLNPDENTEAEEPDEPDIYAVEGEAEVCGFISFSLLSFCFVLFFIFFFSALGLKVTS